MAMKAWEIFFKFHHLAGLLLVALVAGALYTSRDISYRKVVRKANTMNDEQTKTSCDFFSGRWIYDDNMSTSFTTPYEERECSFMDHIFSCQRNGRKDFKYRNWRWQPHQCDVPRFNGKVFLEKLRGKKVIFVGDSLNRNQWVSLLCLIESSLPTWSNKSLTLIGNFNFFHDIEYNTTIGFYWSPFLVESNCDNYSSHQGVERRVVRIEAIEKHARHWNDADILIFDSHAWWLNPELTLLWGSFGSPDAIYKTVEMKERTYEMALSTWSNWMEVNINRTKTQVFFMGASPYTMRRDTLRHCYNRSNPISEEHFIHLNRSTMGEVLESTLEKLRGRGVRVEFLGITRMSMYRSDAHPSIYRPFYASNSELVNKEPLTHSDCLHWCLPGVPDVWNRILYAHIMKS